MRLAMIQMRVEGGQPAANLLRAQRLIAQAASQGAQLALLPEAMNLGWTHPSAATQAEPIPEGMTFRQLAETARTHGLFLCAGLVEREGNSCYNAAILLNPRGELLLLHRKINELELAHGLYQSGQQLAVASTPFGSTGILICSDAFAPGQVIARALCYLGARVLLSPCSWAVPAGHDNVREPYGQLWLDQYLPVARDFGVWIAGVSNVGSIDAGPWQGRRCIGSSLAVGPEGQKIQAPYGVDAETVLLVDIDLQPAPARGDGWASLWAKRRGSGSRN